MSRGRPGEKKCNTEKGTKSWLGNLGHIEAVAEIRRRLAERAWGIVARGTHNVSEKTAAD